jgi:trimeric autotransporter adhesin
MSRPASLPLLLALSSALLLLGGASGAFAQERVGVNSAVNEQATGTPPGRSARPLIIGQEVVYNERITTTDVGQTQLLFLDESSMSIGPNCDLTIDQFVYDPRSGTGKLAMTTTRGLLRYVGGKLSKQDDAVTMRTNSAVLAVRGGAFLLNQAPSGSLEAVFIYGRGLTVTGTTGVSQTLQRPGFAVSIAGPGAAPSAPFPVPPGQLAQLLAQLDGRPGASGGSRTVPTEEAVASSGVSQTISGNINASVQQATAQTQVATAPTLINPATVQTQTSVQQAVTSPVDCAAQGNCPPQTVTTSPTRPVSPTTSGAYGGFYKTTPGTGSSVGFVSTSPAFNIPYTGGQIGADGFYTATLNGSTIRFPVAANGGFRSFTQQEGTDSPFGPISGTSFITPDRTFLYANNTEVDFTDEHSFVYGGIPVNPSFYPATGNTRTFAFAVQPDAALQSNIPFIRNQAGGNIPNPTVSPYYVSAPANTPFARFDGTSAIANQSNFPASRALQASLAVNGQGPAQTSVLAITTGSFFTAADSGKPAGDGIVRGSFLANGTSPLVRIGGNASTLPDGAGNTLFGGNNISGFVLDQGFYDLNLNRQTSTSSEIPYGGSTTSYGFAQPAVAAPLPPNVGVSRTSQTLTGNFGGVVYPQTVGSGFGAPYALIGGTSVTTNAANGTVRATFAGSDPFGTNTATLQFGFTPNATNTRLNSAFIDDSNYSAIENQLTPSQVNGTNIQLNGDPTQASRIALVTGNTVTPNALLPNGLCQACQFLQWGFWTGELDTPNSAGTAVGRRDRAHINTWIAGIPTSAADLNVLQGSAVTGTYTGNAIGSVVNNGASYLASGGFNASYNFGTQNAAIAITNFDGKNFAASGRLPLSGANYTAPFGNTAFSGQIRGSFYGPMAAETGGSFAVQSVPGTTPYLASGIFAGKR